MACNAGVHGVGSLIVDDIQDESDERRGGPCAHLIYGEPLCINAGTAAYFMCEHLIKALINRRSIE